MRTKKVFGFFTAAVMAVASLPILSVGAADSTVLLGDVDQDGVITGHDSAMVSRYLNVDSTMFTEEQLKLADINEDGVVDQTDADLIHEKEVFCIGDFTKINEISSSGALRAMYCYAYEQVGEDITIVKKSYPSEPIRFDSDYSGWITIGSYEYGSPVYAGKRPILPETDPEMYDVLYELMTFYDHPTVISELDYNLIDANGDGVVTLQDAVSLLYSYCMTMAGSAHGERVYYFSEGRYDLYDGVFYNPQFEENAKL